MVNGSDLQLDNRVIKTLDLLASILFLCIQVYSRRSCKEAVASCSGRRLRIILILIKLIALILCMLHVNTTITEKASDSASLAVVCALNILYFHSQKQSAINAFRDTLGSLVDEIELVASFVGLTQINPLHMVLQSVVVFLILVEIMLTWKEMDRSSLIELMLRICKCLVYKYEKVSLLINMAISFVEILKNAGFLPLVDTQDSDAQKPRQVV